MKTWIQLSHNKAHTFYRVPLKIARADHNNFYGMKHNPYDTDGPWPLIAFLQDETSPNILIFQIYSIPPQALEFEEFNPLTEPGGNLSLTKQELVDLIELLEKYTQRLPLFNAKSQKMFKKIEDPELTTFRLHPEWFPRTKRYHYYQIYDPLNQSNKNTNETILILSIDSLVLSHIFFRIVSFPLKELRNSSFNPLRDALARIHLDRNGLQELASLLRERLSDLV